jgi:phage FluMu protein Com
MTFKKQKPIGKKQPIKLRFSMDEPKGASIMVPERDVPVFAGDETVAQNICCGKCGHVLAVRISMRRISNIVIRCFKCKAYNFFPDSSAN